MSNPLSHFREWLDARAHKRREAALRRDFLQAIRHLNRWDGEQ